MQKTVIEVNERKLPLYEVHTLVIGSGAASLNAALHLDNLGVKDQLVVTNKWGGGISNNSGSDKQTYYKLSMAGAAKDSPHSMATDYFHSGGMHGDLALIESALSPQEFFHLVELGVDFPCNQFGEYIGYKTDHDPKGRGTSAGPWTSRQMFSCLAEEVTKRGIEIKDGIEIIALLTMNQVKEKKVIGAIGIDKDNINKETAGFVIFRSENVIFGVGGPGGLYKDSVYPEGHIGSIGVAFEIGAVGDSLPEGQFGIASTSFRWNLSGTYQQVIPAYYSTDQNGEGREEFLNKYFPTMQKLATAIFLKGYQWPFDPHKITNFGSSLIDLLVHIERKIRKRRVFLDYTNNPSGGNGLEDFSPELLEGEPKEYLANSNALFGKPIDRLKKMNPQAVDLFKRNGIDLTQEPLEISVCAQHNNGGLKGDIWWESNVKHLFPIGEVNGSHGVSRPGGSALNAGQVGGLRAAQYINAKYRGWSSKRKDFEKITKPQIKEKLDLAFHMIQGNPPYGDKSRVDEIRNEIQNRMSECGAHIRNPRKITKAVRDAEVLVDKVTKHTKITSLAQLPQAFQNLHLTLAHLFYLKAIEWYIEEGGGSRGSYLILDENGKSILEQLGKQWRYRDEDESYRNQVQETYLDDSGKIRNRWVRRRPIPKPEYWFENVWEKYREEEIFHSFGN